MGLRRMAAFGLAEMVVTVGRVENWTARKEMVHLEAGKIVLAIREDD